MHQFGKDRNREDRRQQLQQFPICQPDLYDGTLKSRLASNGSYDRRLLQMASITNHLISDKYIYNRAEPLIHSLTYSDSRVEPSGA